MSFMITLTACVNKIWLALGKQVRHTTHFNVSLLRRPSEAVLFLRPQNFLSHGHPLAGWQTHSRWRRFETVAGRLFCCVEMHGVALCNHAFR